MATEMAALVERTEDHPDESFEEFDDLEEEDPEPDWPTPYVVAEPDEGDLESYRVPEEADAPTPVEGDSEAPADPGAGPDPSPEVEQGPT